MDKQQIANLEAVNYWEQAPEKLGLFRSQYINYIMDCLDNNLLKVLIGQRRCGKSYILKQVISQLLGQDIAHHNILYLNFELHELHFVRTAELLAEIIRYYYENLRPKGKTYLFFDEIQEVDEWEKVINSYLANERYDIEIFLTGSNAHLLSSELSTYVTGRYIEIPVYPFSYYEYLAYQGCIIDRASIIRYLEDSGIPEFYYLKDRQQKIAYLLALKDSIIMNDIIRRFNIKNPKLLILILDFLIDNIGHLFSLNSIVKKLKSLGTHTNAVTVGNYVRYLEMTFIIHGVSRYDVKGKRILEGERKYYLNDLAFLNYLHSKFDDGINRKLENFVYLALVQSGYRVYVGNIYQLEIDFVAEKDNEVLYIQVTYLLHSQEIIDREYGNLEKIQDSWPKWVVTLDEVSFPSKAGILHVSAWNLLEKLS